MTYQDIRRSGVRKMGKRKQFNDYALAEAYKTIGVCKKVAEQFGCTDETVRRALIKYGVPRITPKIKKPKREELTDEIKNQIVEEYHTTDSTIKDLAIKYKRTQGTISKIIKSSEKGIKLWESNFKVTDEDFIQAAKTCNCKELAYQFRLSGEQVYKRAKKLGLKISTKGIGGHWKSRAKFYGCKEYDNSITLKKLIERDKGICQICGQPIDEKDIKGRHIRSKYPTLDHIIPLSKGGTHTWDNIQLAHMKCNGGKCNKLTYTVKNEEAWT